MKIKRFNQINESSTQSIIDSIQRLVNELGKLGVEVSVKTESGGTHTHVYVSGESHFSTYGPQTYANIYLYLLGMRRGLSIRK